jgi:hypothetical protein
MSAYDVYIHADLLDRMPRDQAEQAAIMKFIRALAHQPHARGDFTEKDMALRPQQVKVIGNHAVTYWTDNAVRKVMVVDIRDADC